MTMGKYDGELQYPHPERIEEARKRCGLCHLVIGERTYFPGSFEAKCGVNFKMTRGGVSNCGILTQHPGDRCLVETGEKTELGSLDIEYKGSVIDYFNTEHFSRVRWWGEPDPEENG